MKKYIVIFYGVEKEITADEVHRNNDRFCFIKDGIVKATFPLQHTGVIYPDKSK